MVKLVINKILLIRLNKSVVKMMIPKYFRLVLEVDVMKISLEGVPRLEEVLIVLLLITIQPNSKKK